MGEKLTCIAVDDEPLALSKICEYISRVPYLELKGQFVRPVHALEYLHRNPVDLIFLDIQMDLLNGIQFMESLIRKPLVIITTAYSQFALKGYDLDAIDYLLKPFNFERFIRATERAWQHFSRNGLPVQETPPVPEVPKYIFVKNGRITDRVDPDKILYAEGMSEYLAIYLTDRKIISLLSFRKLERHLPPGQFIRIHKSYMVAINRIESVGPRSVRIAGRNLPVGDKFRKDLLKRISGMCFG